MNKLQIAYKMNVIRLAKHHRKNCNGENCNISLMLLMRMATELGVKFSNKELEYFI